MDILIRLLFWGPWMAECDQAQLSPGWFSSYPYVQVKLKKASINGHLTQIN
jgi:hypothetical protein